MAFGRWPQPRCHEFAPGQVNENNRDDDQSYHRDPNKRDEPGEKPPHQHAEKNACHKPVATPLEAPSLRSIMSSRPLIVTPEMPVPAHSRHSARLTSFRVPHQHPIHLHISSFPLLPLIVGASDDELSCLRSMLVFDGSTPPWAGSWTGFDPYFSACIVPWRVDLPPEHRRVRTRAPGSTCGDRILRSLNRLLTTIHKARFVWG